MANRKLPCVLAAALALTGCESVMRVLNDKKVYDLYTHVEALKELEAKGRERPFGRIPRNLKVENESEAIATPLSTYLYQPMSFRSLDAGRICFGYRQESLAPWNGKDAGEFVESWNWVTQAHDSLAEFTPDMPWPTASVRGIDSVTPIATRVVERYRYHDDVRKTAFRQVDLELCGPAPVVTDSTKYISLTRQMKDEPAGGPVLIWAVTDDMSAPLVLN